jgi:hypothetical protein
VIGPSFFVRNPEKSHAREFPIFGIPRIPTPFRPLLPTVYRGKQFAKASQIASPTNGLMHSYSSRHSGRFTHEGDPL